jgi:hypothetical protein
MAPFPLVGEALRLSLRRDPRSGEGEGFAAEGEPLRQPPCVRKVCENSERAVGWNNRPPLDLSP